MHIFEITIQHKLEGGDGWPVVVEQSEPGTFLTIRNEGTLHLDQEQLLAQATPHAYGTLLGQALFSNDVYLAFMQARAKSQTYADSRDGDKGDSHLHVLLYNEDPDLKLLRWERLCAPLGGNRWDFLAQNQRTPFSLYLPSATDRRFPFIGWQHLRALILVANPQNLDEFRLANFDAARTVSSVRRAMGDIPGEVLAAVDEAVGPPSLNQLCQRITAEPYALLHIVAHGQYSKKTGETILFFADEENRVAPVTGTDLITRLERLQGARGLPHFAFLSTCDSAKPEAEGALGGLGQRLVRELGMPAVLAMTDRIGIRTAEVLAAAFYTRLSEHGKVDQALAEAYSGLTERYDIAVPALFSRLGGQPLFIDTPDLELSSEQIEFGLMRLKKPDLDPPEGLLPQRAPVLQDEFEKQAKILRRMLKTDRATLNKTARQEWDQAMAEVNAICEEILEIGFRALALGEEPPTYDDRRPFPGLLPFKAEDQEFFFGREKLVEELINRLQQHNFLAILGASGSGKSSLVLAGLIPALQKLEPGLQMLYMTPKNNPDEQIQEKRLALENVIRQKGNEAGNLQSSSPIPILVVDQFEELFTLCNDKVKRQAFLDQFLDLAGLNPIPNRPVRDKARGNQPKETTNPIRVIITMRADFWGECAPYRALKMAMLKYQELLSPMNTKELRSAMERQAARVGLRFEADLSNTILRDVQGEPGAMPLLQHALLVLWQRRHGRWLLTKEYSDFGGVRKAIAQTADNFYRELKAEEKEHLRNIFIRLTRLDEDVNIVHGEGRRDTRRRVPLAELIPADSDRIMVRNLVTRLADERLVVTSIKSQNDEMGDEDKNEEDEGEQDKKVEVEVAHEALIREWPRLRNWLDEDREGIRLQQQLSLTAGDWDAQGRDEDDLYRGQRLEKAEAWLETHPGQIPKLDKEFLEASRTQVKIERRQAIRRRWIIGGLVVGVILALFVAFTFFTTAQQSAERAQQSAERADLSATSAVESAERADLSATSAVESAVEAYDCRAIAEQSRAGALSCQFTATAMAKLIDGERDLSILLALEAVARDETYEAAIDALRRAVDASEDEGVETLKALAQTQLEGRWWTEDECQEYLQTDCSGLRSSPGNQ